MRVAIFRPGIVGSDLLEKLSRTAEVELVLVANVAEDIVAPLPERQPIPNRPSIIMGWAGVGGSFLFPARQAAARFGVSEIEILLEAGRRRVVSGQDDVILEIALQLARESERSSSSPETAADARTL